MTLDLRKKGHTKFRKGRNMSRIYTLNLLNKIECKSARLVSQRMGLCFAHSSMDKHKLETCVSVPKEY